MHSPGDSGSGRAATRAWSLQVRRLPVVDEDRLVGMLAQADIAHVAKDKKVAHLEEAISEPANV